MNRMKSCTKHLSLSFCAYLTQVCFTLLAVSLVTGCTKDPSSGNNNGTDSNTNSSDFRSNCGTVFNSDLQNPVSPKDGIRGSVRYIGSNLVALRSDDGEILIKLHGLGVPSENFKLTGAKQVIETLNSEGDAYFYKAEPDCDVSLSDGGLGVIGHVFSASGKSYAENILESGYGLARTDACQGRLISECYGILQEEADRIVAGELEEFLWKPVSDNDGKLAIHTGPYGTSVVVNGELGTNRGPGNGFGSLARFRGSGCSYGSARVEVVDDKGARYLVKGQPYLTIPDGCQRWILRNGELVRDSK
jgi:hypothetical protein